MDTLKQKILGIIEKNSRIDMKELAVLLGTGVEEILNAMQEMEDDGIICGYRTMIDWNKTDVDTVTAFIEVKLQPQRGDGFDRIASHIYRWPEVTSVYLMSGGFDLAVTIQGKSLNEVAMFVAQKLAPMEGVTATATHFVLKKYKDHGVEFVSADDTDHRNVIV